MIARALQMSPQARTVLYHLNREGSISPLEAAAVHSVHRLAARILELRKQGFHVVTDLRRDYEGHRYARYSLIGEITS